MVLPFNTWHLPTMVLLCANHTRTSRCKKIKIAKMQERARKDVEQCFGVLQAHFGIIQNPYRLWQMDTIYEIDYLCDFPQHDN